MKVLKTVLWASIGVASWGLWGCEVVLGGRPRPEPVYVQQGPYGSPTYVEPQQQYVVVPQPPPPVIVERRPPPPSGGHVWIDGYWHWDGQQYRWEGGRYEVPPQPGVVWVAPRYDRDAHGYRYAPGQWRR